MLTVFIVIIVHWYVSLFFQTFFLHRYGAHHMFDLSPFWEKVFFTLTYFCQGPSFLNPKGYSILHQRHHEYTDTAKDPHSPHFSKNLFQMMAHTLGEFRMAKSASDEDIEDFIDKRYPVWPWFERLIDPFWVCLLWVPVYFSVYLWINPPIWMYPFMIIHFFIGPIQGAIVNWFGHTWGYRNYPLKDKSTNTLPLDLFLMGELFQNNHHKNPRRPHFAVRWFECDPAYYFIVILRSVGILRPTKSLHN